MPQKWEKTNRNSTPTNFFNFFGSVNLFSGSMVSPSQRLAEENEEINEGRLEHKMTDEFGVKNLVGVMANAIADSRSVSILLDSGDWEAVDHVACGQWHPLVEVRRVSDKHTLFLPAARIVAVDVGEV